MVLMHVLGIYTVTIFRGIKQAPVVLGLVYALWLAVGALPCPLSGLPFIIQHGLVYIVRKVNMQCCQV